MALKVFAKKNIIGNCRPLGCVVEIFITTTKQSTNNFVRKTNMILFKDFFLYFLYIYYKIIKTQGSVNIK